VALNRIQSCASVGENLELVDAFSSAIKKQIGVKSKGPSTLTSMKVQATYDALFVQYRFVHKFSFVK